MKGAFFSSGLLLLSCLALFVGLKVYGLRLASGDENIYFYLAAQLANGE